MRSFTTSNRLDRWRQLPLLHRVLVVWLLLALPMDLGMLFFGEWFFVSPDYMHLFIWPSVLVAVLLAVVCIILIPSLDKHTGVYDDLPRRYGSITKYILVPVGIGGMFGFLPLVWGVPWVLNYAVGQPYSISTPVLGKLRSKYRVSSCNDIYLKAFEDYWFGRMCVSDQVFDALQNNDQFDVQGTKSWFGIEVIRYSYTLKN